MIEFFTLASDRLNLNGDQANVFVLRKRLDWLGVASSVTEVAPENFEAVAKELVASPEGKFVMLGHGSKAAMGSFAEYADSIRSAALDLASAGVSGLAVGSCYEMLCPDFKRIERVSDYADVEANGGLPRTFGYVNTDTNLPVISLLGERFVVTMVHGPVFARTPELADQMLFGLGVSVGTNANSVEADLYAEGARAH